MDPFNVMQLVSRAHLHFPKLITLKKVKVAVVPVTSEGRWKSIWRWRLSTKDHSSFFSLFSSGQGGRTPSCQSL